MGAQRSVEALDVVAITIEQPVPLASQPENVLIADRPWRLVRRLTITDAEEILEGASYGESAVLGDSNPFVDARDIPADGLSDSLALIRVFSPRFDRTTKRGGGHQLRAKFSYKGSSYDLPITFELDLDESETSRRSASNWWFTISLGEEYMDCHYKLIAGAIRIPPDRP